MVEAKVYTMEEAVIWEATVADFGKNWLKLSGMLKNCYKQEKDRRNEAERDRLAEEYTDTVLGYDKGAGSVLPERRKGVMWEGRLCKGVESNSLL